MYYKRIRNLFVGFGLLVGAAVMRSMRERVLVRFVEGGDAECFVAVGVQGHVQG